jgi:hypothetical protein
MAFLRIFTLKKAVAGFQRRENATGNVLQRQPHAILFQGN